MDTGVVIHYHGTPVGGSRSDVVRFLRGRHALIPFARPDDLGAAPSEPSAEHWRRAIGETFAGPEWPDMIEQRTHKIAREGK